MASSGSFHTTAYSGRYLTFAWEETSQSVSDNKTTISWTLKGAGGDSTWYYTRNIKVTIDGETVYHFPESKGKIQLKKGTLVASGSYTFTHGDDGAKSFTAYAEAGIYKYAVNCNGTATFALDTIVRASRPSCGDNWPTHEQNVGSFGDTIHVHMNRTSSAFTHTVRYAFGSITEICIDADTGKATTAVEDGFSWTIPLSLMNEIPDDIKGSGTIYVDTYNGSTKIGETKWCSFTATVPDSVKPSCSLSWEDITSAGAIYGNPVKNLSRIKATITGTPAYSSPIKSCSITIDDVTYPLSSVTTGLLTKAGSSSVTATVTDTRGRISEPDVDTMTVLDYNKPKISKLAVHRCNSSGIEDEQGDHIKATFTAAVSSMGGKNVASYTLKHKKSSDSFYTTVTISDLKDNYAPTDYSYVFAADGNSSYDVEVTVLDRHDSDTRPTSASTAFTLMNWNAKGNGICFGGVAEEEKVFRNNMEFRQVGNSYAFQADSVGGKKGYTLLAVMTLNALNVNAPIVFTINRRGALCPMHVYVRFAGSSETTDPVLDSITYDGDNYGAFLVKSEISTWRLYVDNTTGESNPCLQSWYTTHEQTSRIGVTFPGEQLAGTNTDVLVKESMEETFYVAAPSKTQYLFDLVYPIGSIYLAYNHINPATLFGGTWERIQGAFLWAAVEDSVIGTRGGSEYHSHSLDNGGYAKINHHDSAFWFHEIDGVSFAGTGTASASGSNKTTDQTAAIGLGGETDVAYTMPPYIQISAWRRTA